MKSRAVFLDRDDTIIVNVPYLGDPRLVALCPTVSSALPRLRDAGFRLVVVSNQSGVGRGLITQEQVAAVNAEMERQLQFSFDGIYNSYARPEDLVANDRKPSPQLVFQAAQDLSLDLTQSYFVGDKLIDIQCGKAAGTRTALVLTGTEPEARAGAETVADFVGSDLNTIVDWILSASPST